jgi:hypothetical protein
MNNDTRLIWEQFEHRAAIQKQKKLYNESLIQEQYTSYLIEQILIEEGLMDTVKNAAGKVGDAVKNIGATVNAKMIQPIVQKAVDWLKQNDPDALVQVASAASDGQGALDQVISQQGGDQVEQQIVNAPINEDFDAQYKEMLREHILYLHQEGLLNKIGQGAGKLFNKAKELPGMVKKGVDAVKSGAQDFKQGFQQGTGAEPATPTGKQEVRGADGKFAAGNQSGVQFAPEGEPQAAQAGGDKQGVLSKIMGWVKENPNMSKAIAMGIMGAASVGLGAAFATVLTQAAAGYAIAGGMKGVPKYLELRKQGVEPMEALKQAGATAHDSGMSGATLATGAGLAGNVAGKLMGGGGAAAGGEPAVDPNSNDYSIQSLTSDEFPSDSSYVNKIFKNPSGTRSHVVGGMRSGVDSMIDDFEESILPRPGWANKKII